MKCSMPLSLMESSHTTEFHDIILFWNKLPLLSLVSLCRLGALVAHSFIKGSATYYQVRNSYKGVNVPLILKPSSSEYRLGTLLMV